MLQLLDYLDTYPDDDITYCDIAMVLACHAKSTYFNVSKYRSRAGNHITLSEDALVPPHNGPVLTIA